MEHVCASVSSSRQPPGRATARARWGLSLVALAWSAVPSAAAAQPLVLEWEAPASCQRDAEVRARVAELVRTPALSVDAHARVQRTNDGFQLTLTLAPTSTAPTRRTLEAASCDALVESAALILAVALGGRALGRRTPVEERLDEPAPSEQAPGELAPGELAPGEQAPGELAPGAPHATPRSGDDADPVARTSSVSTGLPSPTSADQGDPATRWAPRGALALSTGIDGGSLPRFTAGARLGVGVRTGWLGVSLDGFGWLPRRRGVADDGAGGRIHLLGGGLDVCAHDARTWLELRGCVRVELGRRRGVGYGIDVPRAASSPWLAPGASLGTGVRLRPWLVLWIAGELAVPLARAPFVLDDLGTVHRPARVVGRGHVTLEARLGEGGDG